MLGAARLGLELGADGVDELRGVRDEHRAGAGVVLGLADEVRGDQRGARGCVGEDRDLGGARLGVDADDTLDEAFGGRDEDVAGPGDDVDGFEGGQPAVAVSRGRLRRVAAAGIP